MADILIRGMEEPPYCLACRMLDGDPDDGFCHAANKWLEDEWFCWYQYPDGDIATDKPLNCPLVPLPEGHGRLGDLDALFEKMYHLSDNEGAHKDSPADDALILRDSACYLIENAPTIVPAEGGNADA